AEQSLLIPVSPNDQRLTTGMKDTVRGFASRFGESAAGMMQIQVPSASHNSRAAELLAKQIRTTLSHSGIPADRIHLSHYRAGGEGDAAPIRLVYVATRAMTGPCGQWPEDLSNDTLFNENWHNFGCASQNNLAAQIANPTDLLGPRAMTPIDASQRAAVIESYRAASDD
ncbi:MAG TPA: CpaD family pilus assembly lipoprotein, partial [Pseudorhizobium sp.]|nr:CpaD family pilus assembly lipoprotein [Pseudorhizobium sp.]